MFDAVSDGGLQVEDSSSTNTTSSFKSELHEFLGSVGSAEHFGSTEPRQAVNVAVCGLRVNNDKVMDVIAICDASVEDATATACLSYAKYEGRECSSSSYCGDTQWIADCSGIDEKYSSCRLDECTKFGDPAAFSASSSPAAACFPVPSETGSSDVGSSGSSGGSAYYSLRTMKASFSVLLLLMLFAAVL